MINERKSTETLLETWLCRFRAQRICVAVSRRGAVSGDYQCTSNGCKRRFATAMRADGRKSRFGGEGIWRAGEPPWRQPRGKSMVSLVNSHTNATRIGWHMWAIDSRFAPGLPPGG